MSSINYESVADELFYLLLPYLGQYVEADGGKTPAFSRNTNGGVTAVGLEAALCDPKICVEVHPLGGRSIVYIYQLALTQWQGRATITEAVNAVLESDIGFKYCATPILLNKGDNCTRYAITFESNCPC